MLYAAVGVVLAVTTNLLTTKQQDIGDNTHIGEFVG